MVTYTPFKALHGAKIEDDGNAEINVERYPAPNGTIGANIRIQSQASAGRILTSTGHSLHLGANDTGRIEIQSGGLVSIPGALTVSGTFNATLATAAQTNITSLGSLSSLDVNGDTTVSGNLSLDGSNKELRFYEGANYVGFEAPALSANKIWVLPAADGSANQALTTDGSGNFQWTSAGSIAGAGSNLSLSNGTNNRIVTAVNGSSINGEANLTFDGSTLTVAGNALVANNGSLKANGAGYLTLGNTGDGVLRIFGNGSYTRIQPHGNHLSIQTNRDEDDIIFSVSANNSTNAENTTLNEAMRIEGSSGRIGIGTTAPDAKLEIKQTEDAEGSVHGLKVYRNDSSTSVPLIYFHDDNAYTDKAVLHVKNDRVDQYGINAIFEGGRVGIGTTAPESKLEVVASLDPSGSDTTFTYAETLKLDVEDSDSAEGPAIRFRHGATGDHNAADYFFQINGDGGGASVHEYGSNWGYHRWFHGAGADGNKPLMKISYGGSTNAGAAMYGTLQLTSATAAWDVYDGGHTGLNPTSFTTGVYLNAGGDSYINGGNLAIGTTSPFTVGQTAKLSVAGGITWGASNTDLSYFRRLAAGEFQWQTYNSANTGEIHLQPYGGKVGIGNAAPSTLLHLLDTEQVTLSVDSSNAVGSQISLDATATGGDEWRLVSAADGASTSNGRGAFGLYNIDVSAYRLVVEGTSGHVGIGTATPSEMLHVESADEVLGLFKSTDAGAGIKIDTPNDGYAVVFFSEAGTNKWSLGKLASNSDKFSIYDEVNNTPRLVIASSGYVGIGTTSPTHKLHLHDASRVDIKFSNDNDESHYIRKDGDYLRIRGEDDSTVLMEIRNNSSSNFVSFPSGNVGIGTTAPDYELDVAGNIGVDQYIYHNGDTDTYLNLQTDDARMVVGNDIAWWYDEGSASKLHLSWNGEADVEIGNAGSTPDFFFGGSQGSYNGKLGIGTNEPCAALHVGGYNRIFSETTGYVGNNGNMFDSYSWSPMADGSSPPAGFTINGAADENSIVYGRTPLGADDYYGSTGLLWRFQDNGSSSASGGFLTATPYPKIDRDKSYRMSCWIKRSHINEGSYYMGFYGMNGATGSNVGVQDVSRRGTLDGAITPTGTFNATFTNGSAVLTNISINTNLLTTGMSLFDAADGTFNGIPDETTIQSIDSSSQITMSANATAGHSLRGVNYGKTSITLTAGHGLIDAAGTSTRYAVINNVDKISYTDINNNILTGIPLTGTYAISQAHADDVKIMQLETNAYFSSGDLPSVDKWYLVVGYVQARGDTDYTDRGGVYDGETGVRVAGCGNFMWFEESTYVKNRVYMFYSDDSPEQIQHAFQPRFEEISGAVPVNTLLGGKIKTGLSIKNNEGPIVPTSGYVTLGEYGGVLQVQTLSGYLRIGPASTSWSHITTDRAKFYMNKPIVIDGGNTSGNAYSISSYSSEDLVFATQDGAENRMTIKSDTGNVGIGTTSPSTALHVKGSGVQKITVESTDNEAALELSSDSAGPWVINSGNGSNDLRWYGNGAVRMQLTSAGNLGIGTTSPDETLHVLGPDSGCIAKFERTDGENVCISGTNGWGNIYTSDAVFAFGTGGDSGGDSQMVINGSNVGIGTTTPASPLDIYSAAGNHLRLNHGTSGNYYWMIERNESNGALNIINHQNATDVAAISISSDEVVSIPKLEHRIAITTQTNGNPRVITPADAKGQLYILNYSSNAQIQMDETANDFVIGDNFRFVTVSGGDWVVNPDEYDASMRVNGLASNLTRGTTNTIYTMVYWANNKWILTNEA